MSTPVIVVRTPLTIDRNLSPAQMLLATGFEMSDWFRDSHEPWETVNMTSVVVNLIDMSGDYTQQDAIAAIADLGLTLCPDSGSIYTLAALAPKLQLSRGVMDPNTLWIYNEMEYLVCISGNEGSGRRSIGVGNIRDSWQKRCLVIAQE